MTFSMMITWISLLALAAACRGEYASNLRLEQLKEFGH